MTSGTASFLRITSSVLLIVLSEASPASVSELKVEYRQTPIGIDVTVPRFSWRHEEAPSGMRGFEQKAYEIKVKDPTGQLVWDSGKIADVHSLAIAYSGSTLHAETRYSWSVTAWDNRGDATSASSWFETGLMNPDPHLTAWEGARWIGGTDADLPLFSSYLSVFDLAYSVSIAAGSERAAMAFSANDPRVMDSNKNIHHLHNSTGHSYVAVELDIGGIAHGSGGLARLNVYRAGYSPDDVTRKLLKSLPISAAVIGTSNAHEEHRIGVNAEGGKLTFRIDGRVDFTQPTTTDMGASQDTSPSPTSVNINPGGEGDTTADYGHLCEFGFLVDPGQSAAYQDVEVANSRKPAHVLFHEDLTRAPYSGIYQRFVNDPASGLRIDHASYVVNGGAKGAFIVADPSHNSMPMLRTTFDTQFRKVAAARLYITARGIYEVYLNGQRIGEDYYNPGFTQYNRTQLYQTYDVTNLVTTGRNALGAMLSEGWWSGLLTYKPIWNFFGDRPSLLAKLVLEYEDGSREVITTNDRSWKLFNQGPVVYSSLYLGEVYDATHEALVEGWSTGQYDDHAWRPAVTVPLEDTTYTGRFGDQAPLDYDRLSIVGQIGEPARIYQVLTAREVREVRPGVYVYDFGQNIVGVPRVSFSQGVPGQRVTLRVAEMLYPALPESGDNAGMIMRENYRMALSQDIYIMRSGAQKFQPRFTSHGFRYLEITGVDSPPAPSAVEAVVISSVRYLTANYETSNSKINRLWANIVWSNVGNFLTLPTDCPQRNERLGWSGDISVFSRTATYLSNVAPFLERHLRSMRDVQESSGRFTDIAPLGGGFGGLLWGSAGITIPWELYQQYGDIAELRVHYSAMAAYIDYLATTVDPATGLMSDTRLGDWLGPQNGQLGSALPAAAYHVYDLWIMMRTAEILGKTEDARKYRAMYTSRKVFFNKTFVGPDKTTRAYVMPTAFPSGDTVGQGHFQTADTQSAYAIGLALGAFNDKDTPTLRRRLVASVERRNEDDDGVSRPPYSLMTGFIGTAWISKALSDAGRTDVAYRLLTHSQYPSWLYPVDQGATTIWERLNGYTLENGFGGNNRMNSFNHYAFGAIGQWLIGNSLGIQRGEPGFRSFVLQPEPDPTGTLTWAKGEYDSEYGVIRSAWHLEHGALVYTATVPPNTTAVLHLPTRSPFSVRESGKPVREAAGVTFERFVGGIATYRLLSGSYEFRSRL